MSESFEGYKVVVVGGGSGIGLSTAHQVVAGGGAAVVTGRDQDRVRSAVKALSQNGKVRGDVAPEVVKTPLYLRFVPADNLDETVDGFDSFYPLGRVGSPEDIANAVSFPLPDNSSWMTGAIVDVDGGVMAGRN
jgi:NAD(P)-dependent dehydrogenase (short-subunit alcohol dehydrogenase family)